MSHVNKYLRNFKQYKVASHNIWTVTQEERKRILKLDWNESTIGPSPKVRERLLKLFDKECFFNLYPSTYNSELYDRLSNYVGLPKTNIQYFASSDSLHEYVAKLFISVGDPVVILWPSYDNFRLTAEVSGGHIYYFNYNDDFTFDEQKFIEFIEKVDASLVYICNPNNPIGYLHPNTFILNLLDNFPETMFLADEAYFEFTSPKTTCADYVLEYNNLLVSRTMSKAFGIANFRFGYLLANEKNISYISAIRNPKNITTFAQEAAIAVLDDVQYMDNYVEEVNFSKEYFIREMRELKKFGVFDSAANYVMIKLPSFEEKIKLFDYLKSFNIFVRPISQSQSVMNCLRITIGTRKQMEIVVNVIKNFYGKI